MYLGKKYLLAGRIHYFNNTASRQVTTVSVLLKN